MFAALYLTTKLRIRSYESMMIGKVLKKELFKVSALVHFLDQVTTELTFQNIYIYIYIYYI